MYKQTIEYGLPHTSAILFQQFAGRIYLVGGAVRDIELKIKTPRDFDYVAFATVQEVLTLYPDAKVEGQGDFATVTITVDGVSHDIVLLKPEPPQFHESILKLNSVKRDFTINARYVGFTPQGKKDFDPWDSMLHANNHEIEFANKDNAENVFFLRPERYFRLVILVQNTKFKYSTTVQREVVAIKREPKRFAEACVAHRDRILRQYLRMIEQFGVIKANQLIEDNQLLQALRTARIPLHQQASITNVSMFEVVKKDDQKKTETNLNSKL